MNTISTALTRPRSSSGVTSGRIVWRRTTLTMSTPPPTASARSESHIASREPEHDHRDAVGGDHGQQRPSRTTAHGPARHDDRGDERADGGRGTEHAEPRRPDLEHVTGEHRQEGDRAAEEHGEQIERDRAEEHGRPPDEPDAAEDAREVGRAARRRPRGRCAARGPRRGRRPRNPPRPRRRAPGGSRRAARRAPGRR